MKQSSLISIIYGHIHAWQCKPIVLTPCLAFTGLASFPATKTEALRGGCHRWVTASTRGRGKMTCTQNRPRRHYSTCNEHNAPLTANLHHVTVCHVYAPFHGHFHSTTSASRWDKSSQREHGGRGRLELLIDCGPHLHPKILRGSFMCLFC